MYNWDLHLYSQNNRISIHWLTSSIHNSAGTSNIHQINHGVRKVVSQTFLPNFCNFRSLWEPYVTQDIQIGGIRLKIVVNFEVISLVEHCACGLVVLLCQFPRTCEALRLEITVGNSIYFHVWHFTSIGCRIKDIFVTFSLNFWKGGKIPGLNKGPKPSLQLHHLARPVSQSWGPVSQAAEQPSPVVT